MYKYVVTAAIVLIAANVFAQVEVVDRNPPKGEDVSAQSKLDSAKAQGELYYQVQLLQQEVLELRGKIEEQDYQLKKLKQQHLDDYIELDRRVGSSSSSSRPQVDTSTASVTSVAAVEIAPEDERLRYHGTLDLLLKKKDYSKAKADFSALLEDYPRGRYAANVYYWLGEIFLLEDDLEQAKDWFAKLLQDFPEHSKVPDGKYKLGTVQHLLGEKEDAKELLQEVAHSNTGAARLAKKYLEKNFKAQ